MALPATAPAAGGFDLGFQVAASNGYTLNVGGYDATATISAAKADGGDPGRRAWSTYVARGKVSPTAMHASFGALGRVDVRFRPTGPTRYGRRHDRCIGPHRYTIRPGAFVGSLRFRGEGGYTSANVHRVTGKIVTPRRLICRDTLIEEIEAESQGGRRKHGKVTRLYSFLRSGLTAMLFSAEERDGKAGFFAAVEQTVGSLGVFRGVFVRASPATFTADNALSLAGVTPPPPFSGSASFQRGPTGAKSLAGSLAVSFPGAPNLSLTDPRFKTQLTRSW